ncbi:LANO_0B08306g1_1 [Lachancea nothofagi CBS 11611]|uniref:LANO_0B08306g1_1 n=1 Tax=Lachancea nothofagi CBS 11611 TaxID=1266666 RepID=A0A1G4J0K4_9SACH|nr:LANO_0B08306g1_1 [Lachancea nothofagi CBS 11611]
MSNYDERDKCHFYYKIGACRHGDRCSKKHIRPVISATVLVPNMYRKPTSDDPQEIQEDFNAFFEDVYMEGARFGELQAMVVCENKNDHLNGNVYLKFATPKEAHAVKDSFNTRWYNERPLYCEFSHVSDFRDAICRKHDMQSCERGDECNFMHVQRPSQGFLKDLESAQWRQKQMN